MPSGRGSSWRHPSKPRKYGTSSSSSQTGGHVSRETPGAAGVSNPLPSVRAGRGTAWPTRHRTTEPRRAEGSTPSPLQSPLQRVATRRHARNASHAPRGESLLRLTTSTRAPECHLAFIECHLALDAPSLSPHRSDVEEHSSCPATCPWTTYTGTSRDIRSGPSRSSVLWRRLHSRLDSGRLKLRPVFHVKPQASVSRRRSMAAIRASSDGNRSSTIGPFADGRTRTGTSKSP